MSHHVHSLFSYNGNYYGKEAQKQNILENSLSDGPSSILTPLYNSNVAKLSNSPNQILSPLYDRYFCHITIILILILDLFCIVILNITEK